MFVISTSYTATNISYFIQNVNRNLKIKFQRNSNKYDKLISADLIIRSADLLFKYNLTKQCFYDIIIQLNF